ncbi:Hypothetical predicted protein [Mytilus galloprovincialis]|uniref:Uncharacterized protein n=1 Tax=Mytilus galloprovincialis TaxID=29158 RepID=A0A8B6C108_MYTGA|nr:Hypothetical predicted protein [Mytilus galloprovincialis]
MSLKLVDQTIELETIGGFHGQSLIDVDDVRRLSLYATIRGDDLKDLGNLSGNGLNKQKIDKKVGTGLSLQDLFSQQKQLQYSAGGLIEEESSSTDPLNRDDVSQIDIVVCDQLGIEYTVKGIKKHEFPVIGFHLDNRVCPGFTYHVRDLRTDREVLEGEPRVLQSIGMGYGKRLTFKGDKRNLNDCYFWTDNNPEGYGFAIRVVSKGDNFVIYDSLNQSIGDVVIESVEGPQVEESMKCCKGDITKMVRVRFTCSIRYHNKLEQNLYDIANQDLQSLDGLVEITKSKKSKEAMVSCIRDVNISKVGMCTLWNDLI